MTPPTALVTGGAGYIGSHTILEMLNADYNVVCVDNLCNSYCSTPNKLPEALLRVQEITGKEIHFYRVDITDREQLRAVFQKVFSIFCIFFMYNTNKTCSNSSVLIIVA